jgi:hypothetical protein
MRRNLALVPLVAVLSLLLSTTVALAQSPSRTVVFEGFLDPG